MTYDRGSDHGPFFPNVVNAPAVVDDSTSYKAWELRLPGIATITGFVLDLFLAVLFLGSLEWVRRSGHFQVTISLTLGYSNDEEKDQWLKT